MTTTPNSRRTFLGTVAAATALATTAPMASQLLAAPGPSRMRFGLVTYLWGQHMDLPTLIEACQKSGLTGVEVRTEHKHGVEPSLTAEQRIEVRNQFTDSGITLVGYGANAEFHSDDPAKVKANIELTKDYVRLMHDCGGEGVKVKPNGFVKDVSREKTVEQIGKALNEVAAYAEGFGQQIRVEVHGKGTSELDVIRDIFRIATHPNVGVCWNSNAEDLKGEGLEVNFHMVKDRFGSTCHVRELDDQDYPYAALFKLFRSIDYEGWILLEARTDPSDKVAAMTAQKTLFDRLIAG
ncbi:MAG: sugar phosphate isomerase/epimerase family protein [Pirellulaceae bacterium]|nr:sugar phosphate isomerase/epimerase family protein [Pirellulaceae bacterium]